MSDQPQTDSELCSEDILTKLVRAQSMVCIRKYTQVDKIELIASAFHPVPIYAHWMSMVLLATDELQIVVKVHFNDSAMDALTRGRFKSAKSKPPRQLNDSFINEMLNLLGTAIKNALDKVDINVGMSLPIVTRGFDNYFFAVQSKDADRASTIRHLVDVWKLRLGEDSEVTCSFDADIFSDQIMENIGKLDGDLALSDTAEMSTDLEFL